MEHKTSDKKIIDSSPQGPALGIVKPEEKERQAQIRKESEKPAAPGDIV